MMLGVDFFCEDGWDWVIGLMGNKLIKYPWENYFAFNYFDE